MPTVPNVLQPRNPKAFYAHLFDQSGALVRVTASSPLWPMRATFSKLSPA